MDGRTGEVVRETRAQGKSGVQKLSEKKEEREREKEGEREREREREREMAGGALLSFSFHPCSAAASYSATPVELPSGVTLVLLADGKAGSRGRSGRQSYRRSDSNVAPLAW